jgi:hypothetical protein
MLPCRPIGRRNLGGLRRNETRRLRRKTIRNVLKNSLPTAPFTVLSLVIGQTLPRTGFLVSCYKDDISPFLLGYLNIL